jgi:D-arabinose 5-phosphate isomerase GutQ
MAMNLICDIDGILTNGEHIYSQNGKEYKVFGSNDKDAFYELKKHFDKIIFCSADSTGQKINEKKISEWEGAIYKNVSVPKRQELIDENYPCFYVGDGISEPKALMNFCLKDSTPQAINNSNVILQTVAGKNVLSFLLQWVIEKKACDFLNKIVKEINNNNKIVLVGVGKNFSLAQLVSEFFLPYNLIAVPLDANHSLHGSLGIIGENDILIASSKSGNTKELIDMMEALNKKYKDFQNSFLITSNENSLGKGLFKNVFVLEEETENSLYNLSPQNTIVQYLKFYFVILNYINGKNNCTRSDYLLNHQGGSIGEKK